MHMSFDAPPTSSLLPVSIELLSEAVAAYLSYQRLTWCYVSAAGLSLGGLPLLSEANFVNIPSKNQF